MREAKERRISKSIVKRGTVERTRVEMLGRDLAARRKAIGLSLARLAAGEGASSSCLMA